MRRRTKNFKYSTLNEKTDLGISKWLNERNDLDITKGLNEKTTQSTLETNV